MRSKADMSQLIYSAYLTDKTDKDIPLVTGVHQTGEEKDRINRQ